MTEDKGRWTRTPDAPLYSGELLLPSFGIAGIRVTRSDPRSEAYLAGEGNEDLTTDSGDAFSISYLGLKVGTTTVDRDFMGLDQAYIRRVLLRVLDDEEYDEVLEHYNVRNRLVVKPGVPKGKSPTLRDWIKVEDPDPKAQVRITDLRLAKDLRPLDLERELKEEVSGLIPPVSVEKVLRWKWKTLHKPKGMRTLDDLMENEEWYREECIRIKAISFAAATLCLSVDLGLKDLEKTSPDDLTEVILRWREVIGDLISVLDKTVDDASKLLAGRKGTKGGRPSDPELKPYTALVLYRTGHFPDDIARRIGISAPNPREESETTTEDENPRVNKNWKTQLSSMIKNSIEIEQEKFPAAATVFACRDETMIQEEALAAYEEYGNRVAWWPLNITSALADGDDLLGMPADEAEQTRRALIQLGFCIKRGIDPLSPSLG